MRFLPCGMFSNTLAVMAGMLASPAYSPDPSPFEETQSAAESPDADVLRFGLRGGHQRKRTP